MKDCLPPDSLPAFLKARTEEVGAFTLSLLLACLCSFKKGNQTQNATSFSEDKKMPETAKGENKLNT